MTLKYASKKEGAKAYGRALSISTKHSVEIARNIRGMKLERAKTLLEEVVEKKTPLKFVRYTKDAAHKKGMATGKYPVKAAQAILKLLRSAESNALNLGLSTQDMIISHISAHKASRSWRYGRQRRRKNKRTHVQIILTETAKPAKKAGKESKKTEKETKAKKETKPVKKETKKEDKAEKKETKKETKKAEPSKTKKATKKSAPKKVKK